MNTPTNKLKLTKVQKFRPYLSMEEMDVLLECITSALCEVPAPGLERMQVLKSAARSIMKVKISADVGITNPAYITNPRPDLNARLGFTGFGTDPGENKPDFDQMFESLGLIDSSSSSTQTDGEMK